MPRTPIDYSKAIIYKIQHLEKDELVYVGSTTNFINRKYKHKSDCKTKQIKVYEMIRENGGWDCFNMIIIKDYPCQTRSQLEQEEDRVMRELNSSLNMVRAYRSAEDKKIYDSENSKKNYIEKYEEKKLYREKNKERISKNNKERYQKNKEYILKSVKEYQEKNREQINKKRRELRIEKKINAIDLKK